MIARRFLFALGIAVGLTAPAFAQSHPAAVALSSRPGAAYTIYLDFSGFTFNGQWVNTNKSPGVTPAYDVDGTASTFSGTEQQNIQKIWSRTAEKYAAFNVNVTTVDPAVAANQASNDTTRQTYYDNTAKVMHTLVGGGGEWFGSAGGVSFVGDYVTANAQPNSGGLHTNFAFPGSSANNDKFVGEVCSHENGHGLELYHASDYNGNTLVNEYSGGTGNGFGPGTKAPTMGNSYAGERGLFRIGNSHIDNTGPTVVNEVAKLLTNAGLTLIDSGNGHTVATATALPHVNGAIDFAQAKGVIVPASPTPLTSGEANYVADVWKFTTTGGAASFVLHAGRSTLVAGVADGGITLDATLQLLDSNGALVAQSAATNGLLDESIAMSLAAGTYHLRVVSAADPANDGYFDMGSYFLTGNFAVVPEPMLMLGAAAASLMMRRRWMS